MYPTDLTEWSKCSGHWQIIKELLADQRKRNYNQLALKLFLSTFCSIYLSILKSATSCFNFTFSFSS